MKILSAARCGILFGLSCMFSLHAAAQQLKLGDNPSDVKKEAILELNSSNQGLLLPRVLKTEILTGGKLFNADDGMLVFVNDASEKSLYIKRNGAWEKVGNISTTLTGAVTGSGNGTITTAITNKAVTYNKIQDVSSQSLLGRYSAGDGVTQEITLGTGLLLNTSGLMTADHSTSLWNADKLRNNNISATAPANGEVLKWNGTNSTWEPGLDLNGGATYGTLPGNDIGNADAPDANSRMKIWASPSTGTVQNGPLGTDAYSWNVLSFQGGSYTTQLYFDKEILAVKEWGGTTAPLTNNAPNPWYKVVTTHGDNNFTDGGIIFAGKTTTSNSEVRQRADRLFWNNNTAQLGVGTNSTHSTLQVNGSKANSVNIYTGSVTLDANQSTVVIRKTSNNGNNYTVYLPDAANCTGRIYHIARDFQSGWGNVYVDESVSNQFDRRTISSNNGSYTVQSIGTRWIILGNF
ncbi:hypothetical protein [Chitinophaga cymbidii]|uniref:Uncharacterized protein n=1 Tax=Chitinophaga cymbidii TaxID=1096750 RepID=A0A512RSX1_9BACT|nr:hypothetical protein [Chitinophaga cymbidii]GEP98801.1 hypothetical protein CCY01nite_50610 [Chitinophaga cymbidii]